jgi:site-specific recombinase XerC
MILCAHRGHGNTITWIAAREFYLYLNKIGHTITWNYIAYLYAPPQMHHLPSYVNRQWITCLLSSNSS